MTIKQQLDLLRLLSALESWGFSCNQPFPDYLHDQLGATMDAISANIAAAATEQNRAGCKEQQ